MGLWSRNELKETSSSKSAVPCLFKHAKKELSQDAFLCWLISWAHPKYREQDNRLHTTAIAFLNKLLGKCQIDLPPEGYHYVVAETQFKGIDILVRINTNKIVLVIEDKKATQNRLHQLEVYRKVVKKNFPDAKRGFIYLKTSNPMRNELTTIEEAGYEYFRRRELLDVLEEGHQLGVNNAIFQDYLCWLRWHHHTHT
jgi:hypothetical protein